METPSDRLLRGLVLLLGAGSLACAPVGRMGDEIHIAEESAIIIWDAAAKTQHFIRRASFETKSKDFGFLVPTPAIPTLAESDEEAFSFLDRLTAPKSRADEKGGSVKSMAPAPAAAAPRLRVLATAKIAGFEAAVLEADDAALLDQWLKQHGYASSPDLVEWYRPYVEQGWKITAFKIDTDEETERRVQTSAVRMSFRTDRPYFPYREPASARSGSGGARLLKIYFLGDFRVDGWIGNGGIWPARTYWAGTLRDEAKQALWKHLNLNEPPSRFGSYLTVFNDRSSPRPGVDEVYFATASNQSAVEPPAIGEMSLGLMLAAGAAAIALLAVAGGVFYLFYRMVIAVQKFFRR